MYYTKEIYKKYTNLRISCLRLRLKMFLLPVYTLKHIEFNDSYSTVLCIVKYVNYNNLIPIYSLYFSSCIFCCCDKPSPHSIKTPKLSVLGSYMISNNHKKNKDKTSIWTKIQAEDSHYQFTRKSALNH